MLIAFSIISFEDISFQNTSIFVAILSLKDADIFLAGVLFSSVVYYLPSTLQAFRISIIFVFRSQITLYL